MLGDTVGLQVIVLVQLAPCFGSGALAFLKMFAPCMVKFCAMHSLNLGYTLWLLGSVLTVLLSDFEIWGRANESDTKKLQQAWVELNEWSKQRKIQYLVAIIKVVFC